MEKQFVSYEIALKLKELRFNAECIAVYCRYNPSDEISLHMTTQNFFKGYINTCKNRHYKPIENKITAPLWQQVFDFLREKRINIEIVYLSANIWRGSAFKIFSKEEDFDYRELCMVDASTYEECREAMVLLALNLIAAQQ